MGEEKKEMDAYGIPVTNRPRYFAFKVFGGWAAFSVMLTLFINCMLARQKDALVVRQIESEARIKARAEFIEVFEFAKRELDRREQRIDDKIDSLNKKKL